MTDVRTIGLLGGMSWESSVEYERIINIAVREALGGVHSASLLVRSYDFARIEVLQAAGEWEAAGALLGADARQLQDAGAGLIVLCTNTMHRCAEAIEAAIDVPFLHLADATAEAVTAADVAKVALLGTRYTMEQDFYRARLERHGLTVIVPDEPDRSLVHDVIYDELVRGVVSPVSQAAYLDVIGRLVERGARGVMAGCSGMGVVGGPDVVDVRCCPPTGRLAQAAARRALAGPDEA